MAKIDDLLEEVGDAKLRSELRQAVKELRNSRNFGLVFEEHIPEEVALPGLPVKTGSLVRIRTRPGDSNKYEILSIDNSTATIRQVGNDQDQPFEIDTGDLMIVRRFGEPIYPGLTEVDSIRRGPEDKPAHAVINAENFHALQLLTYTHAGKVDVIYIDPPYNTGARDWKYNNRFVDGNDQWRHSKWLSMMEKRLRLARVLLKSDAAMIVTIDEHEVYHLGLLLEQMFPDARMQGITSVVNPGGVAQSGLSRVEEYALICFFGNAVAHDVVDDLLSPSAGRKQKPTWLDLVRYGNNSRPADRPNMSYPIGYDPKTRLLVGVGRTVKDRIDAGEINRSEANTWTPPPDETLNDFPVIWPIRGDGSLGCWEQGIGSVMELARDGYVRLDEGKDGRPRLRYVRKVTRDAISRGEIRTLGREFDGGPLVIEEKLRRRSAKTVWNRTAHSTGTHGSSLLQSLLGRKSFDFPKSLYLTADSLSIAASDDAVILDFFAGSGTTLHATALLNAQDGGSRQCILVTNNDLSDDDARQAYSDGYFPGDLAYEALGIFESVTRPRIEAALTGRRPDGETVPGRYLKEYLERQHGDGFTENVAFLQLDYLDPDVVGLGRQYRAIAPLLWLAAGGVGEWADREEDEPWSAPPSSNYAVLFDEDRFSDFREMLEEESDRISHVWLVTNSAQSFVEMRHQLSEDLDSGMLYRDYLSNFRVNTTETVE